MTEFQNVVLFNLVFNDKSAYKFIIKTSVQ
jgi:hypothetical protein